MKQYSYIFFTGEFRLNKIEAFRPEKYNATQMIVNILMQRSFWKIFITTYLPTLAILIIVQLTFYFPEDNIQVRATVILSCFIILVTVLAGTNGTTPITSDVTYLQVWIMFAVSLTFADACLQTLYGYIKQEEKKDQFSTSRVNDVSICIKVFII